MIGEALSTIWLIFDWLVNKMPLKHPYMIFAIIPVAILLIIIISKTFVRFGKRSELKEFRKRKRGMRAFLILTRLLIFSCLIIAMASPVIIETKEVKGDPSLLILSDSSFSFNMFNKSTASRIEEAVKKEMKVKTVNIASGNRSALGDGILNNLEGDDSILLVSDGYATHGKNLDDVVLLASSLNSTINAVELKPQHDDTVVKIKGPRSVITGSEAVFRVDVEQAGSEREYILTVKVDDEVIFEESAKGEKTFDFSRKLPEGYHMIKARVRISDFFPQNNQHLKTIHVIPKPKMLFVAEDTSLLVNRMLELYDVTLEKDIVDPQDYSVVVLNNIPASQISEDDVDMLTNYVTEGGGLFVIGGDDAYDLGGYSDTLFETLLPVKSGEGERVPDKRVSIVIVIDISGSTGGSASGFGGDSKVDVEKALAVNILNNIKNSDYVGVVAFNAEAFVISKMSALGPKKFELAETISSLQDGGGTDVGAGIREAEKLLLGGEGSKNMIIISDGVTLEPETALQRVSGARLGGITSYSVGVGEDTDEEFMSSIADLGSGIYFKPDESQKLKIIFGEPEDDDKESKNLFVLNPNHFVTKDLDLSGEITGYNQVVPKSSASTLVTNGQGNPLIVAWRFGLGRVASMATDDGSKWSGAFFSERNSKAITRTVNWAIGDPTMRNGNGVLAEDTRLGKASEVFVKSESQIPQSEEVEFKKIGENLYKGLFRADKTGFFDLAGAKVAVNYHDEFRNTGMNPNLKNLVSLTRGEMFSPDDIDSIIEATRMHSVRKEAKETSYMWPFILAALLIFLFEITIRKISENRG